MKRRRRSGTGSMAPWPWSPSRIVLWISFRPLRRTTWWATTTMTFSSATGGFTSWGWYVKFHYLQALENIPGGAGFVPSIVGHEMKKTHSVWGELEFLSRKKRGKHTHTHKEPRHCLGVWGKWICFFSRNRNYSIGSGIKECNRLEVSMDFPLIASCLGC